MSETPSSPTPHVQPLMNRRLVKRGIIGAVLIVVFLAGTFIVQNVRDVDLPATTDTVGYVAAIQELPNGSQAVMIKPDGTLQLSNGYHDGENDRDPVWRRDGNRLFFTSDRDPQQASGRARQVNLFRWNPGSGRVERRTATQGSYTGLTYSTTDPKGLGLVALGGVIVEFDPVTGDTSPVLPSPPDKNAQDQAGSEEGRKGSIENSFFSQYGSSFKSAVWFDDNKFIVAIMKGEEGETLLLQDMTMVQDPTTGQMVLRAPIALGSGEHIDMDVNAKTGCIVFTLQAFKITERDIKNIPPEYIKNGQVAPPYRHMIGLLDPKALTPLGQTGTMAEQPQIIVQTPNDQNVFGSPMFSPDGSGIVVTYGVYSGGEMAMKGLVAMPASAGGGNSPSFIHKGPVTGMSFSGDGKHIAYSQREKDGTDSIHVMGNDGSGDQQLLVGKGSFTQPRFSPQTATP
jgi:hypothetical protein